MVSSYLGPGGHDHTASLENGPDPLQSTSFVGNAAIDEVVHMAYSLADLCFDSLSGAVCPERTARALKTVSG